MAIKIAVILTDDAPIAPFVEPINASIVLDTPAMTEIVVSGVVDRSSLQSYLMLGVAPLADAYEEIISHPPALLETGGTATPDDGPVVIIPPDPPRLELTAAPWNYMKPDGGNPAAGQIVHGNLTLKTLSVSVFDAAELNQTAMLELVRPGDTISIDAVTWVVDAGAYNSGGWFDFLITPTEQAAVSDLVVVTFNPAAVIVEPPVPVPPLPTTTAEWWYVKSPFDPPPEPPNGYLIHPNMSVDTLRVSRVDYAGIDQSEMLGLVITGDNISLGSTTWNVLIISPTLAYVDFVVSPATQDSVGDGVIAVTFSRPVPIRRS